MKEYAQIPAHKKFKIRKGDWFGFYAKKLSNSNIFINRGDPFYLSPRGYLDIYAAGLGKVKKGDKFNFAVFSLAFPGVILLLF